MTAFEPIERVLVATIRRNVREELRIELFHMADGAWRFSARVWFREDGEMKPSRNGFTLPIDAVSEFAGAVTAAVGEARDRGAIE
jgi:hypothetical protein